LPGADAPGERLRSARRRPLFDAGELPAVEIPRAEIERILPHRGSMLLLDRITHLDLEGRRAAATRRLDPEDPVLAGHFPGDPLYPGVLLLEMGGQLGLYLGVRAQGAPGGRPRTTRLLRVLEAVFLAEARPGMELTLLAEVLEDDGWVLSCAGQVLAGETIVCVAGFEAMVSEEDG